MVIFMAEVRSQMQLFFFIKTNFFQSQKRSEL